MSILLAPDVHVAIGKFIAHDGLILWCAALGMPDGTKASGNFETLGMAFRWAEDFYQSWRAKK